VRGSLFWHCLSTTAVNGGVFWSNARITNRKNGSRNWKNKKRKTPKKSGKSIKIETLQKATSLCWMTSCKTKSRRARPCRNWLISCFPLLWASRLVCPTNQEAASLFPHRSKHLFRRPPLTTAGRGGVFHASPFVVAGASLTNKKQSSVELGNSDGARKGLCPTFRLPVGRRRGRKKAATHPRC